MKNSEKYAKTLVKRWAAFLKSANTFVPQPLKQQDMETTYSTLCELFNHSTRAYAGHVMNRSCDLDAGYTYGEFRHTCERLSSLLSRHGVGAEDRVAIYSVGHPNWPAAFFCATAFGRVAVPVLPDFSGNEAQHVLEHSGAKALFVSSRQLSRLSDEVLSGLNIVICIETLEVLRSNAGDEIYADVGTPLPESLAAIIYTSGTTGAAKGVMLQHRNFIANVKAGFHVFTIGTEDVLLSILPLAHAYELSLGMLFPFAAGSSVYYISKAPTPSYLMKVMQEVRPTAMLSVPLIIEKVYKGTIVPMLRKSPLLHWMDMHMHKVLCLLVGRRMVKTFGGRMKFFGIGGAKLDENVERFLQEARFPYYIGYGLTECAPLLAVCGYRDTVPGQIGRAIHGVELRLDDVNPETGEGEIVARGENVFPGYYRDEARTREAFTADGWFRTGDLAAVDARGCYAIKGRIGNMIVGASGENIYPEEIEKVAREIPQIEDIIVVSRGKKLVALVKCVDSLFDLAHVRDDEQTRAAIASFKKTVSDYVNSRVSVASQLNSIELMTCPFEKTATLKIRRFLYAEEAPTV